MNSQSDVQWSCVQTLTGVNCTTGEKRTFYFRICSLCGSKVNVDGSEEDALRMAKHVEDHETGKYDEDERAIFERMMAFNKTEEKPN